MYIYIYIYIYRHISGKSEHRKHTVLSPKERGHRRGRDIYKNCHLIDTMIYLPRAPVCLYKILFYFQASVHG